MVNSYTFYFSHENVSVVRKLRAEMENINWKVGHFLPQFSNKLIRRKENEIGKREKRLNAVIFSPSLKNVYVVRTTREKGEIKKSQTMDTSSLAKCQIRWKGTHFSPLIENVNVEEEGVGKVNRSSEEREIISPLHENV